MMPGRYLDPAVCEEILIPPITRVFDDDGC